MEEKAVTSFVKAWSNKSWNWGLKDDSVKGWVENFSCIAREDLIRYGMFNERIDCYGGMTQELRERYEKKNKFLFKMVPNAKAIGIARTHGKAGRRKDIRRAKNLVFKLYNTEL